jgi:hypothetical protein
VGQEKKAAVMQQAIVGEGVLVGSELSEASSLGLLALDQLQYLGSALLNAVILLPQR